MNPKTVKIHDGIVGSIILASTLLGFYVNPLCFWLAGLTGILMIVSAFTNLCPVYYLLGVCGLK